MERPRHVFLAAAKVGGIPANATYPAEFMFQNLMIEANVIESAYKTDVDRLLALGSSCIYPKLAAQPLREESLLSGGLEPTNRSYAVAKIAELKCAGLITSSTARNIWRPCQPISTVRVTTMIGNCPRHPRTDPQDA